MGKSTSAFTPQQALSSLTRLEGFEPLLRARAEGLTTMMWGLIVAAIFFTYQVVHTSAGHEGSMWLGFLWVPWVLAGVSATFVVWRSTQLSAGGSLSGRRSLLGSLPFLIVFLLVFAGALLAFFVIGDLGRLHEPGYMTLVFGVAALALAALPVPRSTRTTRLVHLVVGGVAIGAALLVAFGISPNGEDAAFLAQTLTGASAVGGGWFVGGLVQAGKR